jgi:hypothetical protein
MVVFLKTGEQIRCKRGFSIVFGVERCSIINEDNQVQFFHYNDISRVVEDIS